jgi:hypothetical protein
MQKENQESYRPDAGSKPTKERASFAAQAKQYKRGDQKWTSDWEEVEQDTKIDKAIREKK